MPKIKKETLVKDILSNCPPFILCAFLHFTGDKSYFGMIYYIMVSFFAAFLAFEALRGKNYGAAFKSGTVKTDVFAYILAAGFFADFVNRCVSLYYVIDSNKYLVVLSVTIRVLSAVLALISSAYFVIVGKTFKEERYDFRMLKLLHLAPVFWCAARIVEVMEQAGVDLNGGADGTLKYIMLGFAVCFFFCFASEVENNSSAKKITVLFSKELTFFSALYVADYIFNCISRKALGYKYELLFCFTALSLCMFAYAFKRNIVTNGSTEN